MRITIKNLQQQTFSFEFDPEKSTFELKKKIKEVCGAEYLTEKQKLIYAGIILEDHKPVASYEIDENKFLVVILTRDGTSTSTGKRTVKESSLEADSVETIQDQKMDEVSGNESTKNSAPIPSVRETNVSADISTNQAVEIASVAKPELCSMIGPNYKRVVDSMVEMGYSQTDVERALVASYNNPERAVEYLINGIPNIELFDGEQRATEIMETVVETSGTAHAAPFDFLRNQPQFLQMQALIQQNPDLLHAVLRQIGQTNPALLQLISENQDAFLQMLNEPRNSQEVLPRQHDMSALNEAVASAQAESTGTAPQSRTPANRSSSAVRIQLTRDENDAIERLKAMGFSEAMVLQAYFACEKDEQMAANFLISSQFDD